MSFIKTTLELLSLNDWKVGDEDIDIAKGKYKAPTTWKEFKKYTKRHL